MKHKKREVSPFTLRGVGVDHTLALDIIETILRPSLRRHGLDARLRADVDRRTWRLTLTSSDGVFLDEDLLDLSRFDAELMREFAAKLDNIRARISLALE